MAISSRGRCANFTPVLVIVLTLVVSNQIHQIQAAPASFDESKSTTSSTDLQSDTSWILLGLLSLCSLVTLVTVLLACGACGSQGCLGNLPKIHWFGRTRQDVPMSFENPVVELGNAMPLSQIDVRALELDPVVFEPLPTIHDLSPISQQYNSNGEIGPDSSGRSSSAYPYPYPNQPNVAIKNPSVVIPFATEDSELYAHDWFDEPYRNFSRHNLEFIKEIGKGWFGQVLEAQAKDIVPFAHKIKVLVKLLREDASQIDQMRFLDECRVYRDANQGNILKLLGHSIEQLPFLLIVEQCPQGDLKSYLISNVTRAEILSSQGILIQMALDIAKGLEWMTTNGFKHHDLAARNCQVASEGRIVIGDYGLATQQFKDDYYWNANVPIPLRWAAPETLHCTPSTIQTLKVTKLSNIWSFAVVLWEITEFGKLPYFELSDEDVITRVLAEKNYFLGSPTLPYIPLKEELYTTMRSCWSINPEQRPPISAIVSRFESLVSSSRSTLKSLSNEEDFETKWEQHGRRTTSTSSASAVELQSQSQNEKPILMSMPIKHKKSVSFTGLADQLGLELSSLPEERGRDVDSNNETAEVSKYELETKVENENPDDDQDQDQDQWAPGVERGDIAQKVMEKSQSVQDLMVLTHVEPSELDPDSLVFININPGSISTNTEEETNSNFNTSKLRNSSGSGSGYDASESLQEASFSCVNDYDTASAIPSISEPESSQCNHYVRETEKSTSFSPTESKKEESQSQDQAKDAIEIETETEESMNFGTTTSSNKFTFDASIVSSSLSVTVPDISISIEPATPGTTPNLSNVDIQVIAASPTPSKSSSSSAQKGQNDSSKSAPSPSSSTSQSQRLGNDALLESGHRRNLSTSNSKSNGNGNETPPKNSKNSNSRPSSGRRHASTPKRSTESPYSPLPPLPPLNGLDFHFDDSNANGSLNDVFHEDKEVPDESLNLSPILMKEPGANGIGIRPGEMITSILAVGPSDDLGLGAFQGVTSEMFGFNSSSIYNYSRENDSSDDAMESSDVATRTRDFSNRYLSSNNANVAYEELHSPFGDDLSVLAGNIKNGDALSITPRPRAAPSLRNNPLRNPDVVPRSLFPTDTTTTETDPDDFETDTDGENSTMQNTQIGIAAELDLDLDTPQPRPQCQAKSNGNGNNSSWDVVDSLGLSTTASSGTKSSWDVVSSMELKSADSKKLSTSSQAPLLPEHIETETNLERERKEEKDAEMENGDEFWAQQMQSLSNAANHTRNLFELSLGVETGADVATDKDKFVEDIESANDELGSLVLHDLESEASEQILPLTSGGSPPALNFGPKMAFVTSTATQGEPELSSSSETALDFGLGHSSATSTSTSTSVVPLDHNDSINLPKPKRKPKPLHFANRCAMAMTTANKKEEDCDASGSGSGSGEDNPDNEHEHPEAGSESIEFVPSTWNHNLTPARPAIKSPSDPNLLVQQQGSGSGSASKSSLKKSVSFERKKTQIVYEYPPPPPASDSEEEASFLALACRNNHNQAHGKGSVPMSSALDWELTQEELEFASCNMEESDEEETVKSNPMDVYRISGFHDDSFHVSASNEPFQIQSQPQSQPQLQPLPPVHPSTLGELRHTRDKLRLDLCKGEASLLDEDPLSKNTPGKLLDSGVGSANSANVSPFVIHCDKPTNTSASNNLSTVPVPAPVATSHEDEDENLFNPIPKD